jgi:hypothetical protein
MRKTAQVAVSALAALCIPLCILEHTGTDAQFTDDKGRSPTFKWGMQGSWEGHNTGTTGFAFAPMTKYGKTGLRCARD